MLYLRSWLEQYIDLKDISNQQLSHLISIKSGEVEEYKEIKDWFDGKVLVGRIENVIDHPNAERLKMFEVNLGNYKNRLKIVSAAPNVVEGMLVPTAIIGARLAYLTISERQMRGQKSEGMCMGKSELMLETEYSSGLWDLTSEIPAAFHSQVLGMSICEVLPEYFPTQTVFDIKYLPDKIGFLGCHLAMALELDLILDGQASLKPQVKRLLDPDTFYLEFQKQALKIHNHQNQKASFKDDTDYTNIFSLFNLELKNEFNLDIILQQRLFFTQKNMIGGLADLSNYLLYDVGQPSHFFVDNGDFSWDWEVKQLQQNENFEGLGKLAKTELPTGLKVIEDNNKLVWIPGVSGSNQTKVKPTDTKISIELANFKIEEVARNSFRLNYRSESCRFWNSGVSIPAYLIWILHLLEILSPVEFNLEVFLYWINSQHELAKFEQNTDNFLGFCHRLLEIKNLVGLKLDKNYLATRIHPDFEVNDLDIYLQKIGNFDANSNQFVPNIFYSNLQTQEDILFEIARLFGLDNVKYQALPVFSTQQNSQDYQAIFELKKLITEFGFSEVITRPLINSKDLASSLSNSDSVSLTAISSQRQYQDKLRDSLLPSLLELVGVNMLLGEKEIQLFELDKIYIYTDSKLQETLQLGIVLEADDPYCLTSLVQKLAGFSKSVNFGYDKIQDAFGNGYLYTFDSGITAKLIQIKNSYKKKYNITIHKNIWYLELDLNHWNKVNWIYKNFQDESEFPNIHRSYSLIIDKSDTFEVFKNQIQKTIIPEIEIKIQPVERFDNGSGQDILNLDLTFSSSFGSIDSKIIENWKTDLEQHLKSNLKYFAWR